MYELFTEKFLYLCCYATKIIMGWFHTIVGAAEKENVVTSLHKLHSSLHSKKEELSKRDVPFTTLLVVTIYTLKRHLLLVQNNKTHPANSQVYFFTSNML